MPYCKPQQNLQNNQYNNYSNHDYIQNGKNTKNGSILNINTKNYTNTICKIDSYPHFLDKNDIAIATFPNGYSYTNHFNICDST